MRRLIVSCNMTVDGYMAGPSNRKDDGSRWNGNMLASLDFIVPDREQEDELAATFASVADTVIFGRQTYLDMYSFWSTAERDMATWLNKADKVVLTHDTDFDVSGWNATLAAGDGVEQVRRLKDSTGGALVTFGGIRTLRTLIAAELVDDYWLKVSPAVLGNGESMFSDLGEHRTLALQSTKSFPSGLLDVRYTAT